MTRMTIFATILQTRSNDHETVKHAISHLKPDISPGLWNGGYIQNIHTMRKPNTHPIEFIAVIKEYPYDCIELESTVLSAAIQ